MAFEAADFSCLVLPNPVESVVKQLAREICPTSKFKGLRPATDNSIRHKYSKTHESTLVTCQEPKKSPDLPKAKAASENWEMPSVDVSL